MADYWISTFGGSGDDRGNALAVDPLGGVYFCGQSPIRGTGGDDALLTKYNNSGGIEWQRLLGGTGNERGRVVAVDASRNVYVAGFTTSAGAGYDDALIAKYNSAGALQWQRMLGGTGYENAYAMGIDSSNNVYVIGATIVGSPSYDVLIAKYNSAGTLQWQRTLSSAEAEVGYGGAVDSSGNVYVTGFTAAAGTGYDDALIAKYDTNGTLQWQRMLGGAADDYGYGAAVDSSGNVYVGGYTNSGGNALILVKYNSAGTLQWQRTLRGTGTDVGSGVAVDSSDNVYVVGYTTSEGAGGSDILLAKYNSAGTLQWQRLLGGSGSEYGNSVAVDSSGNLYIAGYTTSAGNTNNILVAKVPSGGALTGVYGPFTYAAASLTASTGTLTSSTSALTSATGTLTGATPALTDMDIITTTLVE